jgi:hypothetical protein
MAKRDKSFAPDKATAARIQRRILKDLKQTGIDPDKISSPRLIQGDESDAFVSAFNQAVDKQRRRNLN